MVNEPHAFEDDIDIVETVENGETVFSAFVDGMIFRQYASNRAGNITVAMQLAVVALSRTKLSEDVLNVAVWFSETKPNLKGYFVVDRYRFQHPCKVISHIVVASKAEVRADIELIVGEAFEALGWIIDSQGGSSVEWFDARGTLEMSAHQRLKAVGRVHNALKVYRQTRPEKSIRG